MNLVNKEIENIFNKYRETSDSIEMVAYMWSAVLTSFTKWILSKRKNNEKIFFLSRDFYIPYIIARDYLNADNVYYLHINRRSLMPILLKLMKNPIIHSKINNAFTKFEQQEFCKNNSIDEILKYLNQYNIQNNDFIADIGYSGLQQKVLESVLHIKLQGFVIKKDLRCLNTKLTPFILSNSLESKAISEMIIGSDEDEVVRYENGKPIFSEVAKIKKDVSRKMTDLILSKVSDFLPYNISQKDCSTLIRSTTLNCDKKLLDFYNIKIFPGSRTFESCINFDIDKIKNGEIKTLYKNSHAKRLFRQMLFENKELSHLRKSLM